MARMQKFDLKQFKRDLKFCGPMPRRYGFRNTPKSQQERAKILGISQSKLSRFEAGKTKITLEEFIRFCNAIGTKPEKYFIKDDE